MPRFLQFSLAFCLLTLCLPLYLGLSAWIWWKLGRPVLFRQVRSGRFGRRFVLYKFRSMSNQTDGNGNLLSDAERLTAFGQFLRKSSLDELPQLWNVLKGEMALVGPRPLLPAYNGRYSPNQAKRMDVLPGITGWAQVKGRNALSWAEKFKLDTWYVEHRSWHLDLKILWLTLQKVFQTNEVSAPNHATMPEFTGKD